MLTIKKSSKTSKALCRV